MACFGEVRYSHDNIFGRRATETPSRLPNEVSKGASFHLKIGLASDVPNGVDHRNFEKSILYGLMVFVATISMLAVAHPGSFAWLYHRFVPDKGDSCAPGLDKGEWIKTIILPKAAAGSLSISTGSQSFRTPQTADSSGRDLHAGVVQSSRVHQILPTIREDSADPPPLLFIPHSNEEGARAA